MKAKIMWLDTETTGVNPDRDDVIQIACLYEEDGVVKEEREFKLSPFEDTVLTPEILAFHKKSEEEIRAGGDPPAVGKRRFCDWLARFVNKYDRQDKLIMAGYNVRFDYNMLYSMFTRLGDKYFGSWFYWPVIDVCGFVALEIAKGVRLPKYTLSDLARHWNVELQAHDALSDIRATREVYKKIISGPGSGVN